MKKGKTYLTEQYLKKYQQGGLTTFSPNPRNFYIPQQGINPGVFNYDITSNAIPSGTAAIGILQQKERQKTDLERIALQREQMKHQKDMQDDRQAFEEAKIMNDFMKDLFKASGGKNSTTVWGVDGNPLYEGTAANSKRYAPVFAEAQQREDLAWEELDKKKITLKLGDTVGAMKLQNEIEKIKRISSSVPDKTVLMADDIMYKNLVDSLNNEKSKIAYSPVQLREGLKAFTDYYNGIDNGYQPGYTLAQIPSYNRETTPKQHQELFDKIMKPIKQTKVGLDGRNVVEIESTIPVDPKILAKEMAGSVLADPSLLAYVEGNMGEAINKDPERAFEQVTRFYENFISQDLRNVEAAYPNTNFMTRIPDNSTKRVEMVYSGIPEKKDSFTMRTIGDKDNDNKITGSRSEKTESIAKKYYSDTGAGSIDMSKAPNSEIEAIALDVIEQMGLLEDDTAGQRDVLNKRIAAIRDFLKGGGDPYNGVGYEDVRDLVMSINAANDYTSSSEGKKKGEASRLKMQQDFENMSPQEKLDISIRRVNEAMERLSTTTNRFGTKATTNTQKTTTTKTKDWSSYKAPQK